MRKAAMKKGIRLVIGCLLIGISGIMPVKYSMASGTSTAQQVMQAYLTGLSNGDVTTLSGLIGGPLKDKSHRLLTQNTRYPQFLRTHYAGVVMTIEGMTQAGPNYEARVRFDYPSSDSSTSVFTLRVVDGQWKIVDEQLF